MKKITAGIIACLIVDTSSVAYAQVVGGCRFEQVRWSRIILDTEATASPEACALACSSSAGPAMIGYRSVGGGQAPCRGWQYNVPSAPGLNGVCTIMSWPDEYPPMAMPSQTSVCSNHAGPPTPLGPPVKIVPGYSVGTPVETAPPVVVAPR